MSGLVGLRRRGEPGHRKFHLRSRTGQISPTPTACG